MASTKKKGLRALFTLSIAMAAMSFTETGIANDWRPYLNFASESYIEPFPVLATLDELDGKLTRGDEAFTYQSLEIGVAKDMWTFALVGRFDYNLQFSSATAEIAHHGENDIPLDTNRSYPIDLHANHLSAQGVKVGYRFSPFEWLDINTALSYLIGKNLMVGTVHGNVEVSDDETFSGDAIVNYSYSDDVLLHRSVEAPTGQGYSFDLAATIRLSERMTLSIKTKDLFNAMYWKDAPVTQAMLTSSTLNIDENGFINTTPVLSGWEDVRDLTQKLPVRTFVSAEYKLGHGMAVEVNHFNVDSVNLPRIGFSITSAADTRWTMFFSPTTNGLTLSAEHQWFKFSVGLDSMNVEDAHYVQLAASVNHHF